MLESLLFPASFGALGDLNEELDDGDDIADSGSDKMTCHIT